ASTVAGGATLKRQRDHFHFLAGALALRDPGPTQRREYARFLAGWPPGSQCNRIPLPLYIPGAFLFPRILLRIGRTSSVRGRTLVLGLVCAEMPTAATDDFLD